MASFKSHGYLFSTENLGVEEVQHLWKKNLQIKEVIKQLKIVLPDSVPSEWLGHHPIIPSQLVLIKFPLIKCKKGLQRSSSALSICSTPDTIIMAVFTYTDIICMLKYVY